MAAVDPTFTAKPRQPTNKSGARKIRASGWIPAVAYGPSSDPVSLALDPKIFVLARRTHGVGQIYDVDVEGAQSFKALVKAVQIDPATRELLHVDLYAVDMSKAIRVEVAVELTGKAAGVQEGGLLQQILRRVEVQCLPSAIPAKLSADVTHMNVGDTLHSSDLTLPEGVRITALEALTVAIVAAPEAEEEPTPEEGEVPAEAAAEGEDAEGEPAGEAKEKDDKEDKGKKDKKDKKDKKE